MRTLTLALAAGLLVAGSTRAQDDAKAIVEKAIKAHGGADNLNKLKGARAKVKGTLTIMGQEIEASGETIQMLPDKAKAVLTLTVGGMKVQLTQLINGKSVTVVINGQKLPLNEDQIADARMSHYVSGLTQLTPLLKEGMELKTLPEIQVDGTPAVGILVKSKDHKDVKMFFNKESGLLVKVDHQASDDGKEVLEEQLFSGYKQFGGLMLPTKETIMKDGKKSQEVTTEDVKVSESIPDKDFSIDD